MTDRFMQRAIALSLENVRSGRGGPFGALVVRGESILGSGTNEVTGLKDPTAHAEVIAIRSACQALADFQLIDCDLYSTCEPCPMCMGAIYWARIARVYYACTRNDAARAGFDDSLIYDEIARPNNERKIPMVQTMRAEAAEVFREWETSANKVRY